MSNYTTNRWRTKYVQWQGGHPEVFLGYLFTTKDGRPPANFYFLGETQPIINEQKEEFLEFGKRLKDNDPDMPSIWKRNGKKFIKELDVPYVPPNGPPAPNDAQKLNLDVPDITHVENYQVHKVPKHILDPTVF